MLISIIIPAYNVENYIEECVHSAFSQTWPEKEVICIDNNSTDGTWKKLQQLQHQYPELIIDKELKAGAPAARNKGLRLSHGQWLQFLDADDLLMPGKIEHQQKQIQQNPKSSFIAGACIKRDLKGIETKHIPRHDHPLKSLFITQLGITSSNLWNRTLIEQVNGWDESLKSSQEADLMFRLLQVNDQVIFDDEPLTIVRERPSGQISQTNPKEKWMRYFNKRLEMVRWIDQHRPELYIKEKDFFMDNLFGLLKIIGNEDLNAACQLYRQHLKGRYRPSPNQNHSTHPYLWLYKSFGFRGAEICRKWQNRLLGR
ncbi:glycosyltransferase family 2 protein [Thermophagus xiamenensis]|uniref:Glycosyltransferase involved in cell wall bisynthesis n=1 Tax=Thermophagus xiamenensis TaxID=385682 RepID=A0A1I2EUP1_9BACT|nr:glycosyltransferase family 2 protein [Thermophagus xiamenensis]SFE96443.1 Glycosyltransferase involved in cell wall bisynthesis [Thermophagus xiamenensis]